MGKFGNSHDYYVKKAKKGGCDVREGGRHTIFVSPDGKSTMACPRHHNLSRGVEMTIQKWFALIGISMMVAIGTVYILYLWALENGAAYIAYVPVQ